MNNTTALSPEQWNRAIARLPHCHLLQTWEWGQVKQRVGWQPHYLTWPEGENFHEIRVTGKDSVSKNGYTHPAAALILRRSLSLSRFSLPLSIAYAPKGPLLDWSNAPLRARVLNDLIHWSRQHGAIFLKIDPDLPTGRHLPRSPADEIYPTGSETLQQLKDSGWRFSPDQIQFRNTMHINLLQSEESLLANMKAKTRYNLRLAQRKGVAIRPATLDDFSMLYRMYAETSLRDGFTIREEAYYQHVWRTFWEQTGGQPCAEALIAEVEGEAVAAVWTFRFAGVGLYLYGMSRAIHREHMPNVLLQWEAMLRLKQAGCATYDLWGAPDVFAEDNPMWGVYRFKEGLGAEVVRTLGAWDYPLRPRLYTFYTRTLPKLLAVMRSRGQVATKKVVGQT